jgi:alpha-galactosidase
MIKSDFLIEDPIMAKSAELEKVHSWVRVAFGMGTQSETKALDEELLFGSCEMPFSFTYDRHSSKELLKTWTYQQKTEELPDEVRHTVSWTDGKTGLVVTGVVTAFKKFPAVDWVFYFENQGEKESPLLENIQPLDVHLQTGEQSTSLHRIAGDNHRIPGVVQTEPSFAQLKVEVEVGHSLRLSPDGGRSSSGTFPFFNVASGDQGLFTAIGWSGQWAAELVRDKSSTRLTAGMELTHLVLRPGEKIRTPRILVMGWRGELSLAQNRFRRLMLAHYSPRENGAPVQIPSLFQNFCRYNARADWACESGQIKCAQVAKQLGFEFMWLDAAWFPGGFPNGVGSWTPHQGFPNGLKPVSDACHELGLKFILWFEPERVSVESEIYREHPEFVHFLDEQDTSTHRDWNEGWTRSGLFKLDDPIALRWMTDHLLKKTKEYGLDWWRCDFNIEPLEYWRKNDASDRQGMTEIRYIEGLYAMWDELIAKNPGLVIDNCASGGRRIDLETCQRSVVLWQSDANCSPGAEDAHQAQNICLSLYIPLHTPCAWQPDSYELRSVVTAGLVAEFDYLNPDFPMEKARALVDEVKLYRKFWYGDLYLLTPVSPEADQQLAFQLHRPDLKEGVVMCFRRANCRDERLLLKLHGLDAKSEYWVSSVDGLIPKSKQSGDHLMNHGINIEIPGPGRCSEIIRVREIY